MANRLVPENLLVAVHDYLMSRPMGEIEGLVVALRQCSPQVVETADLENTASDRRLEMAGNRPAEDNPHKPIDPGRPAQPDTGTPPGGDPPPPPPPPDGR